jgi:hypothetical protein
MSETTSENGSACSLAQEANFTGVTLVELAPEPPLNDYLQAMDMGNTEAQRRIGDHMLLSWYDRDRDFESPQHTSECHADGAVPGYVDYALYRGATLKIDIQGDRFIFFYLKLEL